MIKYRTKFNKIEAFEVEKETPKMVMLKDGRRELKQSTWQNWHDSWYEAQKFLLSQAESKVSMAQKRLDGLVKELEKIMEMTE